MPSCGCCWDAAAAAGGRSGAARLRAWLRLLLMLWALPPLLLKLLLLHGAVAQGFAL